jgi:hypothetical protein
LIAAPEMRVKGWALSALFLALGLTMFVFVRLVWTVRSWSQLPLWARLRAYPWKSLPRKILRKFLAIVLSVLFLAISLLFLAYSSTEIITTTMGVNAQIADVSSLPKTPIGKYRLIYEGAGLFKTTVEKDQNQFSGVFCLYPAWPNYLEPQKGDAVMVWPAEKPFVAAPEMKGKAWIVSVFFLIIGLVMFEFFLLAWTIH